MNKTQIRKLASFIKRVIANTKQQQIDALMLWRTLLSHGAENIFDLLSKVNIAVVDNDTVEIQKNMQHFQELKDQLDQVMQQATAYVIPKRMPFVKDIVVEIEMVLSSPNWCECGIECNEKIYVITNNISLHDDHKTIIFGQFKVVVNFGSNLPNDICDMIEVVAITPNPCPTQPDTTHPNVVQNRLNISHSNKKRIRTCIGEGQIHFMINQIVKTLNDNDSVFTDLSVPLAAW